MYAKWLKAFLAAAWLAAAAAHAEVRTGQAVPAFDTVLLDGKLLPKSELKGRTVLVVFWATWCPVCRRELPKLQELHDKYHGKGFEILALSLDADSFEVEEFWKDQGYRFPVAMRAPEHSKVFGTIKGTPTLFLVDGNGILRMTYLGAPDMDKLEARIVPLLRK